MQFDKGKLYIRVEDGQIGDLFFTYEDIPTGYVIFDKHNIAEMRDHLTGEPSFSDYTDSAQDGETTGSGRVINFREATDEDLAKLFKSWNPLYPLAEWLRIVERNATLLDEEKARIKRIAKPYLS